MRVNLKKPYLFKCVKKRKIKIISVNNKEIRIARDNAEIYYLECLEKLNLDIWNSCFFYNEEKR